MNLFFWNGISHICKNFESELIEFDGEGDHVHLLINYPPKIVISKLVSSLKGVSSRLLRKKNYQAFKTACGEIGYGHQATLLQAVAERRWKLSESLLKSKKLRTKPCILDLKDQVLRLFG